MRGSLIAVDIGNSSTKLGRFHRQSLESIISNHSDLKTSGGALPVPDQREEYSTQGEPVISEPFCGVEPSTWFVVSVHRQAALHLAAWVSRCRPGDDYHQIENHELPIENRVDYPDRVGTDRLAAALGANRIRPPTCPAIVVGAGTAITVDVVSVDGAFLGGTILPGPRLVAKSLSENTDRLPLVSDIFSARPSAIGKSTELAIQSGLYWGTIGAVREVISQIERELGGQVWLCVTGGWASGMAKQLRDDVHWVPNLVLSGIAIGAAHLLAKREQSKKA